MTTSAISDAVKRPGLREVWTRCYIPIWCRPLDGKQQESKWEINFNETVSKKQECQKEKLSGVEIERWINMGEGDEA